MPVRRPWTKPVPGSTPKRLTRFRCRTNLDDSRFRPEPPCAQPHTVGEKWVNPTSHPFLPAT